MKSQIIVYLPPPHFLNLLLDDTLLIIIQKFKPLRVAGSGEGAAGAMSESQRRQEAPEAAQEARQGDGWDKAFKQKQKVE